MGEVVQVKGNEEWRGKVTGSFIQFTSSDPAVPGTAKPLSMSHVIARKLLVINCTTDEAGNPANGSIILVGDGTDQHLPVAMGGAIELEDVYLDNVFVAVIGTIPAGKFVHVAFGNHGNPYLK